MTIYALPLTFKWNYMYSEQLQENFCLSLNHYNHAGISSREIGIRDPIFLEIITVPNLILSVNPHKSFIAPSYLLHFQLNKCKVYCIFRMTNFQNYL